MDHAQYTSEAYEKFASDYQFEHAQEEQPLLP